MGYDVRVARLDTSALFDLRGERSALAAWAHGSLPPFPAEANRYACLDGVMLCHVGPGRWLLRADIGREDTLEAALRPAQAPAEVSIVKVSDSAVFFRVEGPEAAALLSLGCPLDLHPSVLAGDAAGYSEFLGLKALVINGPAGFDIGVDRSHAAMVEDWLARALA